MTSFDPLQDTVALLSGAPIRRTPRPGDYNESGDYGESGKFIETPRPGQRATPLSTRLRGLLALVTRFRSRSIKWKSL